MENEENGVISEPPEKPKLLGMIMNPTEQFKKIRERPVIWVPLIILTVLTIIVMFMSMTGLDMTNTPEMDDAGFSEEDMAMLKGVTLIGSAIAGLFIPIFAIVISTLIFFIVAKIARTEVTFKQLFSMNTFVYVITVLGMLVNGLAFMLAGNIESDMSFTSLNSVVNAGGALGALFNNIEVFAIWGLIVNAIGLQIVGKFSKGLAWGVVIAVFLIGIGFSMIGAGMSAIMGV